MEITYLIKLILFSHQIIKEIQRNLSTYNRMVLSLDEYDRYVIHLKQIEIDFLTKIDRIAWSLLSASISLFLRFLFV